DYTLDLGSGSAQGVGDLNGDGYDDLAFGSSDYNSEQGLVRIHLGSAAGIAASPAQSLTGSGTGDYFGHALASAGDVNGDGYGDLLVGYDMYHGSGGFNGRVEVYLGNGEGVETSEWWGQTGTGNMGLGRVVAGVGDVNGDGYDDFLASEYNNAKVRLYWGDSASLGSYTTLSGSEAYYGRTLSAAGDINQDGYQDVVVGSYSQSKVYVYYGSSSGVSAPLILNGSGGFGVCVGGGGDVNGDGYDDILTVSQSPNGTLNLFLGSSTGLNTSAAWTKSGWGSSAGGYSVDIVRDLNGDGLDEVLVGDTYYSNGQTQEGRTVIFLGDTAGLEHSAAWSTESDTYFGRLGHEVASLGDINGDQLGDFVSVASYYNGRGAIFAYLGQADTLYPGPGNALRLNGIDEYARLEEGEALAIEEFSIMTWAKASGGAGQDRSIFSANEKADLEGFQLLASDGNRWTFSTGDGSSWASVTGDTVLEDTWTHLAATFRHDSLRLYINGNLAGTQRHGLNWPSNLTFLIGAASNAGVEDFWVGELDEMSYWHKALSQSEILTHLAAKTSPSDSNLLACWHFDQAYGARLRDARAHFDAVLPGSPEGVWTTSSVSLGDEAVAATHASRLALAHPDGDSIVVTTEGSAESILLYYVEEEPNSSYAPALASVTDERYWGVKVLDGTSYTIRYYYTNG
ncbi:MAG: LamG-like jellyroll fold domain-containing protein, partial [Bacteroidota bacterium]